MVDKKSTGPVMVNVSAKDSDTSGRVGKKMLKLWSKMKGRDCDGGLEWGVDAVKIGKARMTKMLEHEMGEFDFLSKTGQWRGTSG